MPEQGRKQSLDTSKPKSSLVLSRKSAIAGVATITLGGAYQLVRSWWIPGPPRPKPAWGQPAQPDKPVHPRPYQDLIESAPFDVKSLVGSPQYEAGSASFEAKLEGLERDVKALREQAIEDREVAAEIGSKIIGRIDEMRRLPRPLDEDEVRRWRLLVDRTRKLLSLLAAGTIGAAISQDVYPPIREKIKALLDRLDQALTEERSVPKP